MIGLLARSVFRARRFGLELYSLFLAVLDPRTPWRARLLALLVVAYIVAPIDLLPDVVPLFGIVDDLILAPLGIKAVSSLVPPDARFEARGRAAASLIARPNFWRLVAVISVVVILGWLVLLGVIFYLLILWII